MLMKWYQCFKFFCTRSTRINENTAEFQSFSLHRFKEINYSLKKLWIKGIFTVKSLANNAWKSICKVKKIFLGVRIRLQLSFEFLTSRFTIQVFQVSCTICLILHVRYIFNENPFENIPTVKSILKYQKREENRQHTPTRTYIQWICKQKQLKYLAKRGSWFFLWSLVNSRRHGAGGGAGVSPSLHYQRYGGWCFHRQGLRTRRQTRVEWKFDNNYCRPGGGATERRKAVVWAGRACGVHKFRRGTRYTALACAQIG